MRRPIVPVYRDTRELVVSVGFLRDCHCPQFNFENVKLSIIREGCEPEPRLTLMTDGCSYWFESEIPGPVGVSYPLFEVDQDGNLVFYFDNSLQDLEDGRYVATISANDTPLVSFAIHFQTPKYKINSINKESYTWKI